MIFFSDIHHNLALSFFFFLAFFSPALGRYTLRRHGLPDPNARLLLTMQSYMNTSVDPCQDFYQYACGNWEHHHTDVRKYVDTIGSLDYIINHRLTYILKGKHVARKTKTNEIYRKAKEYLQTCEEQPQFEPEYYLNILKPLSDTNWPEKGEHWRTPSGKWNVWTTLGRLQAVGFNGFPLTVELKHSNASHFYLELDKLYNLGYSTYEQKLIDQLEGSMDGNTRRLAKQVQEFINELAQLQKQHQDLMPLDITLRDLRRQVPNLDFLAYFSVFLPTESLVDLNLKVLNLPYFEKVADLLQRTPQDTLIYALKVRFLGYLEKLMPKVDSNQHCMQHMRDLVPMALDYIYEQEVYRYDRNASDSVIRKVFQTMQKKFVQIIQEHHQEYTPQEIEFLRDKILKMKLNIGNLPMAAGPEFFGDYFRSWQVVDSDFYWNHLSALQHFYSEKFKLLQLQPPSPHLTYFTWPYGSPAYQPAANLLIIPYAYLRYPIFHAKFHELFLYAELGNTLGHEIMHAFDTNGLRYDGDGNPNALFVATLRDKVQFLNSLQCLTQQRSSSLNEKIADFSGFRLAYDSYFEDVHVAEFRGHTSLTNRQLFFVKFSQFFCAISPTHVNYDDSHDTPYRRVPQVVANHKDFEEIFGCPRRKGKFALKKCNLW